MTVIQLPTGPAVQCDACHGVDRCDCPPHRVSVHIDYHVAREEGVTRATWHYSPRDGWGAIVGRGRDLTVYAADCRQTLDDLPSWVPAPPAEWRLAAERLVAEVWL